MSPRPGERWGTSLHIADVVKARNGVVGRGRSNLLLSMVAMSVIENEVKVNHKLEAATYDSRLDLALQRNIKQEERVELSEIFDDTRVRNRLWKLSQAGRTAAVIRSIDMEEPAGVVCLARFMHAYKPMQVLVLSKQVLIGEKPALRA